jgi:predicted RNase H-related nuclease YkuK (DUF458 family)
MEHLQTPLFVIVDYKQINERHLIMWRRGNKKIILYDCIIQFLKDASQYEHEIILGTDSQPFNSGTFLATAIVVLCNNRQYHCRYFYKQHENRPIHHNLYERIFSEVDTTIKVASKIRDLIPNANISIHLDVSDEKSSAKTSRYSRSLVAMVRGYGYARVEVKPNAWCASKVADRHTKRIPSKYL